MMLLLLACQVSDSDALAFTSEGNLYVLNISPDPDPPLTGPFSLGLELLDALEIPVPGASMTLDVQMPDMGHGLEKNPSVVEQDAAFYESNWVWPMSGYWEVRVEIDATAGMDTVILPFEVQ